MLIIPAIDLHNKKVVRLSRGKLKDIKVYSDDPLAVARQWVGEGASLLHIVDLSAAFGQGNNLDIIKRIAQEVEVDIQVGGGIRSIDVALELKGFGVERLVVSTKAMDEAFIDELISKVGPDSIAFGLDVLDGRLIINGWLKKTGITVEKAIDWVQAKNINCIIYTDISRDGMLSGTNTKDIIKLKEYKDLKLIASGGISGLDDIRQLLLKAPFLEGAIVGKALYEEKINLNEAINIGVRPPL